MRLLALRGDPCGGSRASVHGEDRVLEQAAGESGTFEMRSTILDDGRALALTLVGILWLASCDGTPRPPAACEVPARNATEAPLLPLCADTLPEMDPQGSSASSGSSKAPRSC